MTIRKASLGLALLICGGLAAYALNRPTDPMPQIGEDLETECTTCDARQAAKKRAREALQAKAAEDE